MLFGHYTFFTETSFKHICYECDRFYLGEAYEYFDWRRTHYNLHPGILEGLRQTDLSLDFALTHMFNVLLNMCKNKSRTPGLQYPERVCSVAGRSSLVSPHALS